MAVFKDLDVSIFGDFLVHTLGQKYWTVMEIVVVDESADKADQDARGLCWMVCCGSVFRREQSGRGEQDKG